MPLEDRDASVYEQPRRRPGFYLLCLGAGLVVAGGLWVYSRSHRSAVEEPERQAQMANEASGQTAASGVVADSAGGSRTAAEDAVKQASALYQRGLSHEAKGELTEARKAFEEAAKLGDAKALYRCGFYAERGIGGDVDGAIAKEFYEKAGEAWYVDAYAALARMYILGEGVSSTGRLPCNISRKVCRLGVWSRCF